MIRIHDVAQVTRLGSVIPVLQFDDVKQGLAACQALYAGGVKVLEITLRTEVALKVIECASQIADDLVVGAGTLIRADQVAQAVKAGAQFGVSPGLTPALHRAARDAGLPLLPGVMTPSDMIAALEAGYHTVKFFPAQQAGGVAMLQAFGGPFPTLKFCPTGGITYDTASHFLALPNVACVGGSWLAPKAAVAAGDWEQISHLAQMASQLARHGG